MLRIRLLSNYIKNNILYSTKTYSNVSQSVQRYSNVFGKSAGDYLSKQLNTFNESKKVTIKQNAISKDLFNAILYPVKGLPVDLLESFLLRAKKRFPKSKTINKLLSSNLIKKRQQERKILSKKVAIGGCLDSMSMSDNDIFKIGQNRLNPIISNYSSDKERAVSRLASGLVPAVFFANDAYNQSMMINNNKQEAKLEKKRRFKQEVSRIGIMSYAQFVVLGALSKYVNKNAFASLATTTGIVVGTEMASRLIAHKPVTFIKGKNETKKDEHPIVDMANDDSTIKHSTKVSKVVGTAFIAGAIATGIKISPLGKKILPKLAKKYENLVQKDLYISKKDFNGVIKKLNDNGFDKLADKYVQLANNQKGENIYLGKQNRKILHPVVDSIIMTPIKAIYKIATSPFEMFLSKKKSLNVHKEDNLLQGISYIQSIQHRADFKEKLNKKILSSFDTKTKTSYSNHNLAKHAKIFTSGASSYFIVADSYNMVMQKENNKENAKKVSKKVFTQRMLNIGLGAYILTVLNSIFKTRYNKSLYCVAAVSGAFGLLNEGLSRLAVGIPITEKNREEQIKFKQKYSKVMNKLA